ncbi:MAG: DUF4288 domain-containing protein [Janthinobacterium lividum]
MQKISGLENWDLSDIASAHQKAFVSVLVPYAEITAELIGLAPVERKDWIAQRMQRDLDAVLASQLLTEWKWIGSIGQHGRSYGLQGEIPVADLQTLAGLASVKAIQVESTNGRQLKPVRVRKRKSFYCVKMTVAIQIEGREHGMQTYEERYVLFKAYTEAEARRKAEEAAPEYGKPYLNSDGLLVRWKMESLDDVYEVVPEHDANGRPSWEGAEVFSVLKARKITAARA